MAGHLAAKLGLAMGTTVPAGWVFTASIPSWTQTTLEGDEVVVVGSPRSLEVGKICTVQQPASKPHLYPSLKLT